ncbi:glutamate 5-kinase [Candidatus Caldatribacterium sp.]|uniref:glutamate 5-kinase n=1 Tax=Candidatus Caldatribacterium sp. TaxID=2282143 RepID=UPI00299B43F8|nr:glutamate 5-kinase [Candidatus Caldatribacterium sp.]MDW8080700.1 glutamate 5-kinase [Candidatus Calescibacterium sp.]
MDRRTFIKNARRLVVKVGTSLLVEGLSLSPQRLRSLAANLVAVRQEGKEVVLVSSGAVACGMSTLGVTKRRHDIPFKQAMAAIGQSILMQQYCSVFSELGVRVAQILLAPEDVHNRSKYLNARNTFEALLKLGVLPIVNENDTVAVEEIKFGDNDRLSALVASIIGADLLIILSDVAGLYSGDPRYTPDAKLISEVQVIDAEVERMAGDKGSALATGGMRSKILAAKIATLSGIGVVIASGKDFGVIPRLLAGESLGTFFHPAERFLRGKKRWIAFGMIPQGAIKIDDGAKRALFEGKSLLPAGIVDLSGHFDAGDCVEIRDTSDVLIGRGIVNYSSEELRKIRGLRSTAIEKVLGHREWSEEVIHADDVVLFGGMEK